MRGVQVRAVVVGLPDLDQGVAQRIAVGVEYATDQVRHLANGRRDRVVDDQQVVVGVERQLVGIERTLGLQRRAQ